MSAIKKAFQPVIAFLESNKDKKVKDILADVQTLCSAKGTGGAATTFHRDEATGVVSFVKDYYFGLWFPTSHVEFGSKAGSPSGLNSMCKEGVSNWTKQQREFRAAKEALLSDVAEGKVPADKIQAKLAEFEAERAKVVPFSITGMGWETLEEAQKVSKEQLDKLVAAHNAKLEKQAAEALAKAGESAKAEAK